MKKLTEEEKVQKQVAINVLAGVFDKLLEIETNLRDLNKIYSLKKLQDAYDLIAEVTTNLLNEKDVMIEHLKEVADED